MLPQPPTFASRKFAPLIQGGWRSKAPPKAQASRFTACPALRLPNRAACASHSKRSAPTPRTRRCSMTPGFRPFALQRLRIFAARSRQVNHFDRTASGWGGPCGQPGRHLASGLDLEQGWQPRKTATMDPVRSLPPVVMICHMCFGTRITDQELSRMHGMARVLLSV